MIIRKYGITLERLTEDDIELVRQHRNSELIRKRMFYQKQITEEEQKKWFATINNDFNYYFLILHRGKKIGLTHCTIKSYEEGISSGGIFIWEPTAMQSHLPIIASVCATDLIFFLVKMKKSMAEVRADNKIALEYNQKFGYKIVEELSDDEKFVLELTPENYLSTAKTIREMVKKMSNDFSELSWDDIEFPKKKPVGLYENLPDYLAEHVSFES